jgi:acyl carrier protein
VREFVIKTFIFEDDGNLTAETSFLDSGIIDSTGVLELITFIEETYGIQFENHEVVPENLDSIHNIAAFVQRKLGADLAVHCSAAN